MPDRLATVALFGNVAKSARVNLDATNGARVGVNLFDPDGKLVRWDQIVNQAASTAGEIDTTDDVDEGEWHLYFTVERAQDAVGAALTNSANVTLAYDDDANTITSDLADVTVGAGGELKKYGFDAKGRLNLQDSANTDDLQEGAANLYFSATRAQDAVGAILSGAGDVPLAYDDAARSIGASLRPTGVVPGTYGDASNIPQITVDANGRITGIVLIHIGGSTFTLLTSTGDYLVTESGSPLLGVAA